MKKGGSKQKGAAFERLVAKKLSLWISDGKTDSCFWRSAMSGGRATIGFKSGNIRTTQSGDISAIDALGMQFTNMFSIEIKFYKELHLERLIYGGRGGIVAFWEQACRDAERAGKYPLLIAKENFQESLVATTPPAMNALFNPFPLSFKRISVSSHYMELFPLEYLLTHATPPK